jgi:hypothetical protein
MSCDVTSVPFVVIFIGYDRRGGCGAGETRQTKKIVLIVIEVGH